MKFICLSYMHEKMWDAMPKSKQETAIEECFAYDDVLWGGGHWLDGGAALHSVRTAKTLRWAEGKVLVTDGPFADRAFPFSNAGVVRSIWLLW